MLRSGPAAVIGGIFTVWTMLATRLPAVISASRAAASVGGPAFATRSNVRRSAVALVNRYSASHSPRGSRYSPLSSNARAFQSSRLVCLLASTATDRAETTKAPVPVTLLAGFLGSGKTTALKNLLENSEGVRVGVIVNDVAAVNIDAKLISNPGNDDGPKVEPSAGDVVAEYGGTIQLQNGCACCSLADELLTSVQTLMDGREFDAVVVELSGVADPVAVKQNWDQAKMMQHPATKLADVDRVVTVIDSCTFGTDWMTWDSAGERDNWTDEGDDCAGERKVPELLAEQVEAADLLLVNKIDLAGPDQVKVASSVAKGLNDKAGLFEVKFGKIAAKEIIGNEVFGVKNEDGTDHDHSHDHNADVCSDPDCKEPSHDHSHSHDHGSSSCLDPDCSDSSHSHSHDHDSAQCTDPDCTDTSHSHSHNHGTSTDKLGISNFVYRASVPFNSNRLLGLLNKWPVPIKEDLDIGQLQQAVREGIELEGTVEKSPFIGVLRSKGFCWMAPSKWSGAGEDAWRHDTAMYWSHAGKHFGITTAGKWWGSISKEQMKGYFVSNMREYERILEEDWASEEWGDRRQELVFIGTGLDEKEISDALNDCLLTDEEMNAYKQQLRNFIDSNFTAESIGGSGPSLFDTGGTDHLDVD